MLKIVNTDEGYRIFNFYQDGSWSDRTGVPDLLRNKFFPNEASAEIELEKYMRFCSRGFEVFVVGVVTQIAIVLVMLIQNYEPYYIFYLEFFGILSNVFYIYASDEYRKWKEQNK